MNSSIDEVIRHFETFANQERQIRRVRHNHKATTFPHDLESSHPGKKNEDQKKIKTNADNADNAEKMLTDPFTRSDTSGRARLRRRSLAHALNQNAFHIPRAATVSRESLVRPARVHRRRRSTIEGTLLLRRGPVRHTPPPCRRRRPDRSGHAARRSRTARRAPGRIPNTAAPRP